MSNFAERLRALMTHKGINASSLAKKIGVTPESIYVGSKREDWTPRPATVNLMAKALGTTPEYLRTGLLSGHHGASLGNFVSLTDLPEIPIYTMQRVSAGYGTALQAETPEETRHVGPEYVELSRGNLAMVRAEGASMEPLIYDGDLLIVDFLPTNRPTPGVYIIQVDDQVSVKSLEMLPGGTLIVKSHNPDYPTLKFDSDDDEVTVRILGRVLGQQRQF